jgi:hypothetical protein
MSGIALGGSALLLLSGPAAAPQYAGDGKQGTEPYRVRGTIATSSPCSIRVKGSANCLLTVT